MSKTKKEERILKKLKIDASRLDIRIFRIMCLFIAAVALFMCILDLSVKSYAMAAATGGIMVWMASLLLISLFHASIFLLIKGMLAAMAFFWPIF